MTNKPDFSIFKNIGYAINGMKEVIKSEKSFKVQLIVISIIGFVLFFIPFSLVSKMVLFISTWLILIAEATNSAIERVVDLVTTEHHPLAGQAKDIGAFIVFLSFIFIVAIWIVVIFWELSI